LPSADEFVRQPTRIGLLKAETRNDPHAIREALYEYLDQTFGTLTG
jgi:hypothetical protein